MRNVELQNVCKSYDQKSFAVEDINVEIKEGEFFILVGPSGCGKSTLLRMIAGLEEISAGRLLLGEKEANHLDPSKRELSMVFQNYALYPHLSVEENILFGLKVKKIKKEERMRRCLEAADLLGLTDYLKRKPRELSGGQRQRVALARAVVSQAPICLMDEPLSNLDAKLRGQMRLEIRQLQRRLGTTMIYVTHDQVEAMTMGDRMMILKDGKVQQVGTPLDIYNHPANEFVATFIGAPPMNLIDGVVDELGNVVVGNRELVIPVGFSSKEIKAGGHVKLGLRPEHISHAPVKGSDLTVEVEVVNSEVLGNESIISFHLAGEVWRAKWAGQWPMPANNRVNVVFAQHELHLFDAENGQILQSPQKVEASKEVHIL
ncbi:sn-glycerol-3-phosphate ABC transporter ATP-binding protein UgpC [Alkalihalophilus marmarensis]|uniref:ABC transporter ATP-binding protein n=1 Tax=Alkalihalophilus marmarensis TaxID=521377 RepID=UPI002E1E3D0C|nr:sn-glycerol-3-phosphate ABC transporter ATP-binding protein UgpC [Alkalihalophilus marmarensis]MED1603578.1 sn-glycerol-3-phosphate ABC transporter ATP-binding protein UgpC [Alkalihalophilus marmarensis]